MGQIYSRKDPQLKRNVAIKVSSISEGGQDPRFSKEAEVLAQLAHPNIVPIHNIGVDAQGRFFAGCRDDGCFSSKVTGSEKEGRNAGR